MSMASTAQPIDIGALKWNQQQYPYLKEELFQRTMAN
jgi:hypothetical protein